jgi:ribonucleoside-diphosphate reductase alpha chain/ribonucleoside-triphosphate reductase
MIREIITDKDLELYKDRYIPFGPIGNIVDVRTYRRYLPSESRRENLLERDKRVINYLLSLAAPYMDDSELRAEGELMLDKFTDLKAWPSSRNKWIGGTSISELDGTASFNCSFTIINRIEAFSTTAGLLMLGCGVGFRVFQTDLDQLPDIISKPSMRVENYQPLSPKLRKELTIISLDNGVLTITVGDSREGWCEAVNQFILAFTQRVLEVVINVDSVRPEGERLKRFGGTSSGPFTLIGMLTDIGRVLNELEGNRLRSIDANDMVCAIAKGVVAGSVRRSSLINLFDENDELMIRCKENLYTDPSISYKMYRSQANNTECVGSRQHKSFIKWLVENDPSEKEVSKRIRAACPSIEDLTRKMESVRNSGEPGIDNYLYLIWKRYKAARSHRKGKDLELYISAIGVNPCSEIVLNAMNYEKATADSISTCNLTELGLPRFVNNGELDWKGLEISTRLITRIGFYQTCVTMANNIHNNTQQEERLLGVSVNGWMDAFNLLGWDCLEEKAVELRKWIRDIANNEADKISKKMGIPRALLVTALKPSGTTSQVLGCSSGLHWQWSPFYIRRVRISSRDPLAKTLMDMSYPAYPELYDLNAYKKELGIEEDKWESMNPWEKIEFFKCINKKDQRIILDSSNTVVFEFPVSAPKGKTQVDVSTEEQLDSLLSFSNHYTDHLPSCTISVKEGDWEMIPNWLVTNWDKGFITASFLSYSDSKYPLLPYEAIEEDEFNKRMEELGSLVIRGEESSYYLDVDLNLLAEYEKKLDGDVEIIEEACGSGSCPIR